MKRYEKYKEVDLPWLKEVPEHWEVKPNKTFLKLSKEIVGKKEKEYELLSLSKQGIRIKGNDDFSGKMPDSFENYQIVKQGQLIMCLFDLDQSAVFSGISNYKGKITSAYDVFKIVNISKKFIDYYFRYIFQGRKYKVYSKSVRYTITKEDFKNIKSPIPSLQEQTQIANFLDWKISEIDKLIEFEKSKIEKLEEYKKNIFSFLMKNEKEYKAISLKNILKIKNIKKSQIDRELNLLSVVRDKGIILRSLDEEDENHNVIPEDLSNYKVVYKNDFVMNKMKAWQGSYGISKLEGVVSPAYFVFEFKNKDILKDFFHLSIRCREYIDEFAKYSKGIRVGQWDFDLKEIKNIYFKYPSLDRQNYIMDKVKTIYQNIDEIISKTNNQITYLQELKQTLISDVVTGKMDVRDIEIPERFRKEGD